MNLNNFISLFFSIDSGYKDPRTKITIENFANLIDLLIHNALAILYYKRRQIVSKIVNLLHKLA
jgi:hypothetical protein